MDPEVEEVSEDTGDLVMVDPAGWEAGGEVRGAGAAEEAAQEAAALLEVGEK